MSRRLRVGSIAILCLCSVTFMWFGIRATAAGELSPKEAGKLIAHMTGVDFPGKDVRIKEVSVLGDSAVVVAQIETAFRMVRNNNTWRVAELRTGNNKWEDIDMLAKALNQEKAARAQAELQSIATALESFQRERGFYVESKSEAVLIDQLNPTYLKTILRIDPWRQPYKYEGTRSAYVLTSAGADGKFGTPDDIVVSK